jgi:hypothetical protein
VLASARAENAAAAAALAAAAECASSRLRAALQDAGDPAGLQLQVLHMISIWYGPCTRNKRAASHATST